MSTGCTFSKILPNSIRAERRNPFVITLIRKYGKRIKGNASGLKVTVKPDIKTFR